MNAPDTSLKAVARLPLPQGKLPLDYVIRGLIADRLMDPVIGERMLSVKSRGTRVHPLALVANMNLRTPDAAHELLDLERLTEWLAEKAKLPYHHIDPLRVDFARVVDTFSAKYATAYSILPLAVTGSD